VSANRVCWSRAAIDFATQVDVGGLEVDDPRADALFQAIHQSMPVRRELNGRFTEVSESDVLRTFTRPITSNEPLLLFVKGEKGTGKSHLVRWLKSRLGSRTGWHIVYIEKRNTSLRRVTERILEGIDTPKAEALREELARASSEMTSDEEAMSALLARLDQLVTFDPAAEIPDLPDLSPRELAELRRKAHRLLGDYTFRNELSKPDGAVHRIVRLARGGAKPSEDVDEAELHLTEADFNVDANVFEDLGAELLGLVRSLSNRALRTDIAAICDSYLSRAKAEIFMGQRTDLLDVFEDVREEIAARGKELCLLIEDLVLLHGIDRQLAQALTIPASSRLCKLRAAIAVTSGYLASLQTFTDRGVLFTLDIRRDAISQTDLRNFVGRYLNAGRLPDLLRNDPEPTNQRTKVPNACLSCPDLRPCHETFGASEDGYGFYPFNGTAIDRLIDLASPGDFQPRAVLREVIRAPLEVAEEELPSEGTFPSSRFARTLDDVRRSVPPGVRATIRRLNQFDPATELSLRAFYALSPPAEDTALAEIARYLGARLTPDVTDDQEQLDDGPVPAPNPGKTLSADEIDRWANGEGRISAPTARRIRRWICDSVIAHLKSSSYGLVINSKSKGTISEWQIGSHTLRSTDVDIERAAGGGVVDRPYPFRIDATDENAVVIRGILAAVDGNSLDFEDQGRWFFNLQTRISDYADTMARLAGTYAAVVPDAMQALEILRYAAADPGLSVPDALVAMLMPAPPLRLNPVIKDFLSDVRQIREEALLLVRAHATAAKGTGKPSLLDVGPVLKQLQSHLATRAVESQPGRDAGGQLLDRLWTRQLRAAEDAWALVARQLHEVGQVIHPAEDLAATFKIVDRLVKECGEQGRLPRADSRESYDIARHGVDTEAMETYRSLRKRIDNETRPGDLWDVLLDPLPQLEALRRYAAVTGDLLTGLAVSLQTTPITGEVDTDALIEEFRNLAQVLDQASQEAR
jgi:hypothetical protein